MRPAIFAVLAFCFTASTTQSSAQESSEQKAFHAKQEILRTRGATALKSEATREQAGDCPNFKTTADLNSCLSRQVFITNRNYQTYTAALRELLQLTDPGIEKSDYPNRPPDIGKKFALAEVAWRRYLDHQCDVLSDTYFGGSGQPTLSMTCTQEMTRRHLYELESLYQEVWRH